ncbi:MAG: hypothetical protein EBS37_17000, partial [Betaproteobacteria bacterium]|nr:hypothetical protein [Betaproteobacteria bacterium]
DDQRVDHFTLADGVLAVDVADYALIAGKLSSMVDRLQIMPEGSATVDPNQTVTFDTQSHSSFEVAFVGNQLGGPVYNGITTNLIAGNNTGGRDTLVVDASSKGTYVAIGAALEARVEGRNYGETVQFTGVNTVADLLGQLKSLTLVNNAAETQRAFADLAYAYAGTAEGTQGWDLVLELKGGAKVVLANLITADLQAQTAGFLQALGVKGEGLAAIATNGLTLSAQQAAAYVTGLTFNSTLFGNLTIDSYPVNVDQMGVPYVKAQLAAIPAGMVSHLSLSGNLANIQAVTSNLSAENAAKVETVTVLGLSTVAASDYAQIAGWGSKLQNNHLTVTNETVAGALVLMGDGHVDHVKLAGAIQTVDALEFNAIAGKLTSGGLTVTGEGLAGAIALMGDDRVVGLTLASAVSSINAVDFNTIAGKLTSGGLTV